MFKRLAHACIGATDLKETEAFYLELLGMRKAFEFYKNDKYFGFYAEVGETTYLEFFQQEKQANLEKPPIQHICLEVEDLDAVIATVRRKGGEITDKKQGADESWQAWMTDPNGVRIEIMMYIDTSHQFTGEHSIATW